MIRTPQELSGYLLRELRSIAEAHYPGEELEAVITVPAHFDNQQRQATMDAAEISGIRVRRLLNEPTAAALGYGVHRGNDQRIAVCDLGGGTFDVSIVNVENGVIEVISTQGNLFLGGEDFDRVIAARLIEELRVQHGVDIGSDSTAMQRLLAAARDAKHDLSAAQRSVIELRYIATDEKNVPIDFVRVVTRSELNEWVNPILLKLERPCLEAAMRCGLAPSEIDAVILVGGMTRMPAVQTQIASIFSRQPLKVVNPDEIVSIGAATQCAILDGTIEGVVLLDVTPRALGVMSEGGPYLEVIPRNATIPTREQKILTTVADGQTNLRFSVFEGESVNPLENRRLAQFECRELPSAPAFDVMILVEFTVDVDGLLSVNASLMGSDAAIVLHRIATAGLTRVTVENLRII